MPIDFKVKTDANQWLLTDITLMIDSYSLYICNWSLDIGWDLKLEGQGIIIVILLIIGCPGH